MTAQKQVAPIMATSFALGFIVISLAVYIMYIASAIMVPFLMAVFIWYLINGVARGFGTLKIGGRVIPRILCFALSILCLFGGIWVIFMLIRGNMSQVVAAAPLYQQHFQVIIPKLVVLLQLDHVPTISEILEHFDLAGIIKRLAGIFTGIAGKTLEVLFLTGFLLYEQQFFDRKIIGMVEDKRLEEKIRHIIHSIDLKIQRYIWVKTFVSALAGICTYAILSLVGVNFAEFWGLMAFFLHFIPYVGSLAAIILPSIMALVQFGDLPSALLVGTFLSGALIIIGHILDPRLLGDSMNLSPICIILSLAMWGTMWGVPGMFLAIPILAIIVITLSQFESTRPIATLLSKTGVIDKKVKTA